MEALRINDFMALIVTSRKDYKNNGVASTATSTLPLSELFYIGGVPTNAAFADIPVRGGA